MNFINAFWKLIFVNSENIQNMVYKIAIYWYFHHYVTILMYLKFLFNKNKIVTIVTRDRVFSELSNVIK